jgi:hypothetical protein
MTSVDGLRNAGGCACRQKLVHRPNGREYTISRIVSRDWKSAGKLGLCQETMTRLDERSKAAVPFVMSGVS